MTDIELLEKLKSDFNCEFTIDDGENGEHAKHLYVQNPNGFFKVLYNISIENLKTNYEDNFETLKRVINFANGK